MGVKSRQSGNTLILMLVLIGFVVLAIALFTVNYTQLMLSNKEAKTAIDAAALQAALDLSRVVITHEKDNTYFGNVALVDDLYTDDKGNLDSTKRPVLGINTIMATIRLDALIANELKNTWKT